MTVTNDILVYFQSIIGDSPDQTTMLNFANQAKDSVEAERNWMFLKGENVSQNFNGGDSYLTPKTLPPDFRQTVDSGIYVGNDILAYLQLPFEDRRLFQDNVNHRYYIDIANNNFFICGQPPAGIIYFPYIKQTNQLDLVSNNPVWPNRFWPIIAYKMAILWYAYDQGIKARSWDDRWQLEFESMKAAMVRWDEMLQRSQYSNRVGLRGDSKSLPLVIDL